MTDRKAEEKTLRMESAVNAYDNARGSYPHGQVPLRVICEIVDKSPRTVAGYFEELGGYAISGDRKAPFEKCTATVARLAE